MMIGHVDGNGFHELGEGEFHATGDLGYLDERGRLFLAGRAHDVIKTGGYKIYPEEIERVLPGAWRSWRSVGHWGEVIVAVSEGGADTRRRSRRQPRVSPATSIRAPVSPSRQMPRSLQGKVQRARVRELVLARYALTDGPYPKFEVR